VSIGARLDRRHHETNEEMTMRFMVIVKANGKSEAGVLPDAKMLADMGKFNEELSKAGVLLDLAGLHPSSKGARIRFGGDKQRTVVDGPFAEAKELIAGYWLVQMKSLAECVEWFKRVPNPHHDDGEIEIRQVFELGDFEMPPEVRATHDEIAASLKK
jgi:hypothetical protein